MTSNAEPVDHRRARWPRLAAALPGATRARRSARAARKSSSSAPNVTARRARATRSFSRRRSPDSPTGTCWDSCKNFKTGVRGTEPRGHRRSAHVPDVPDAQDRRRHPGDGRVRREPAAAARPRPRSRAATRRAARSSIRSALPATARTATETRPLVPRDSPAKPTGTCSRRSRSSRPASAAPTRTR